MSWLLILSLQIFCPALGLMILAGLLLFWILHRKLPTVIFFKKIIVGYILVLILFGLGTSCLNAWLWSRNTIGVRLLPPYTSIGYILQYSWQHYLFEPFVAILFAFLVFKGIYFLNKRFQEHLFYREEKYLAAIGILALGWPSCLMFIALVLFLGVLFHLLFLLSSIIKRNVEKSPFRLSFLYFWIPVALLLLLLGDIINKYFGISQFVV